ncbi:aldehyde dehydrogenase family protein [Pseudomonas sp. S32]|uniref:aldehyde dehydrogenase family protein n=1 Tax=Pseudomonas sp. S32 TaxID=2767448 RepID=UPI00191185AA|nr:aldehyde dehydrogenase family protein [Pseudomonas sp. S32]MBK5003812.1 aldehyde dehydrogenase family protein [Pseudomonas sp. S32]
MNKPQPYTGLNLQLIAGSWTEGRSGRSMTVSNPYTQQPLLEIPLANKDDLNQAYKMAFEAQIAWAALGPSARASVMLRAAQIFDERHEELVDWIIAESGSTRVKAEIEWASAKAITLEAASFPSRVHGRIVESDVPNKESRVYRRPLGVVGVISPWNFPFHLTQRSLAPALALGNAVVVKPASDTPVTGGLLLARIFEEAGLPAGVLSVVVGSGAEIGDDFVLHPVPSFISFTGSTPVGQNIARQASSGEHLKHVALELGGNNPFVVLADADLEQAVHAAVVGKFLHQGQICMAINRIIVEDSIYDSFATRFIDRVSNLVVGDPNDPKTAVGPVINQKQFNGLSQKVEQAKREGAQLSYAGESRGLVFAPHVFTEVKPEMELAYEEIFGPIAGLIRARDAEHALELANATHFGLSAAVFSGDLERGVQFARRIHSGMAHVNDIPVGDAPNVPFGGEKNSGLGRFNGDWAIDEFTTTQWVSLQREPRHYPF